MREHWGEDPTIDDQDAFTILVDGEIAGWVGWYEEDDPMYRHGGMDIFVAPAHQGRGIGREALSLVARWLISERGHHRIIIDPAASNTRAIATYARSASGRSASCAATSAARTAPGTTGC